MNLTQKHNNYNITKRIALQITVRKNGPAFTLDINGPDAAMNVDLVPVLEFNTPPPLPGHFTGMVSLIQRLVCTPC